MTDQPDSSPPPLLLPAVSTAFRATLLWRLENPSYAQALSTLGDLLWEHVNETHQFGPHEDAPLLLCELRAAAGELRYAAGYLQDLANERTICALTAEEARLATKAEKWAGQVLKVAGRIEKATGG